MPEIDELREGFRRFRQNYYPENQPLFEQLAREGQRPHSLIIGCCDSRADPLLITDAKPGDLFVVRNVANLVPPCEPTDSRSFHGTSAAIEFAVLSLKVRHIIVMGHAGCGGIAALLDAADDDVDSNSFITPWVSLAARAREKVLHRWPDASPQEKRRACEKAAILLSLDNLRGFPFVSERVANGEMELLGWYFDIEHGVLSEYDESRQCFSERVFAEPSSAR